MPKTKMDYSNTIIYKIFCKDPSIKEAYIGHTTNFVTRKSAHKTNCKNRNSKLDCYIRKHGGWDNWDILILDDIECKNYEEARKAEQSYIDKYNSELNSNNAYGVKETQKHKKTEILSRHNEQPVNDKFTCMCGKQYKHKQSLWTHKKKCDYQDPVCIEIQKPTEETGQVVALLMEQNKILMEQNKEHRQQAKEHKQEFMELLEKKDKNVEFLSNTIKDMIPKMGSNNNTNQFNINMFLNEECKDAINMSDFIKSIQVSIDQLQYTTNNGLDKGITKVIMDNMNKLSKYERPLHCSDLKRETIYIKDDDKWEKDTHKDKLKKAINKTSNKNYTALCDWTSENPDFMKQDDKQYFYAKTTSLIGKPICDIEDKIIKSICKDNFIKE
jgi:hypothetical protein